MFHNKTKEDKNTRMEEARKTFENQRIQVKRNIEKIKHKIAIISGKGGVGKSTVATNLAVTLSRREHLNVGLLDADIDGPNIPKLLGIESERPGSQAGKIIPVLTEDNLKVLSMAFLLEAPDTPIIWRGPMKTNVLRQFLGDTDWGELDYLVIDLPPGTGDAPLSTAQLIEGIDGMIVVTTPQEVALLDARKAVNFARKLSVPVVGIIENMSGMTCPHCGKEIDLFSKGGGEKAAAELDVTFLGRIPIDPRIVKLGDSGKSYVSEHPSSPAALKFDKIVSEIVKITQQKKNI